ncbi:TsgA protein -like protein [Salmonella enterica subsp. salamae]|nr:TsgA protein -like protein [Salmonella enterica subsp. salamae]
MVLAVAGLMFSHSLALFSTAMFVLGLVSGITMSIGTFLITQLYEGRQRGSRLLFTDSFFSMAGMIFPMVAAFLLARSIEWYWVYACIGLVYLAIFILTFGCEFPALGKHAQHSQAPVAKEKWGRWRTVSRRRRAVLYPRSIRLYLLGAGIRQRPRHEPERRRGAGERFLDVLYVWHVGVQLYPALFRSATHSDRTGGYVGGTDVSVYYRHAGAYAVVYSDAGFFSSAIYTSIITLGSQQTKVASPKLVNFILTCGTIGTMLTFVVTGPIVAHSGPRAALLTANGLYAVVFVMCFALGFVSRHRQHSASAAH